MRWLEEEWNNPSRTDWYLLRIAQRVHQSMVKSPNEVTLDEQKVMFKTSSNNGHIAKQTIKSNPAISKEQATAYAKAMWAARLGVDPKKMDSKSRKK